MMNACARSVDFSVTIKRVADDRVRQLVDELSRAGVREDRDDRQVKNAIAIAITTKLTRASSVFFICSRPE